MADYITTFTNRGRFYTESYACPMVHSEPQQDWVNNDSQVAIASRQDSDYGSLHPFYTINTTSADGTMKCKSVEHYYQCAKFFVASQLARDTSTEQADQLLAQARALFESKTGGKEMMVQADKVASQMLTKEFTEQHWHGGSGYAVQVLRAAVMARVANPGSSVARDLLLRTKDRYIVLYNHQYGIDPGDKAGHNLYGRMLMDVRAEYLATLPAANIPTNDAPTCNAVLSRLAAASSPPAGAKRKRGTPGVKSVTAGVKRMRTSDAQNADGTSPMDVDRSPTPATSKRQNSLAIPAWYDAKAEFRRENAANKVMPRRDLTLNMPDPSVLSEAAHIEQEAESKTIDLSSIF